MSDKISDAAIDVIARTIVSSIAKLEIAQSLPPALANSVMEESAEIMYSLSVLSVFDNVRQRVLYRVHQKAPEYVSGIQIMFSAHDEHAKKEIQKEMLGEVKDFNLAQTVLEKIMEKKN